MIQTPIELRQLAGALDELAENHSTQARQFARLELAELSHRALGRALTLRAAMCEIVLMAETEEAR